MKPQKLLHLAAVINTKYGHATPAQCRHLAVLDKPKTKTKNVTRNLFQSRALWRSHLEKSGVFVRKQNNDEIVKLITLIEEILTLKRAA